MRRDRKTSDCELYSEYGMHAFAIVTQDEETAEVEIVLGAVLGRSEIPIKHSARSREPSKVELTSCQHGSCSGHCARCGLVNPWGHTCL